MRSSVKSIFLLLILLLISQGVSYAASTAITVSATILSKSKCKFNTKATNLAFGNLDPLSATDVTRQATLKFVCNGSANPATYIMTDDDGLNESGPNANRMLHDTLAGTYLPYSFSMSPPSGTVPKGEEQTLTITGIILGTNYQSAFVGGYSDTVTVTINP